jgi:hypothetical protein
LTAYLGLQSASTWVSICLGINLKQLLRIWITIIGRIYGNVT